jgi:hypothetical protein
MLRSAQPLWIALALVGMLSGCSKAKSPWEVVYPASGILTFEGKPISGAQVTLFPVDPSVPESVRPTAITEADGRFKLSTFSDGDGAPKGDYKVSAIWHPLVHGPGGAVRGDNKLPVKYSRPDSSGLTVKVEEGGSSLPPIDIPAQ